MNTRLTSRCSLTSFIDADPARLLAERTASRVLDVRTPGEFEAEHIAGHRMLLLGLALASVIGLSLGLLGGGGSILTAPVLVYVLGYAAKPAIAMSLPVVGITSVVGGARRCS